MRHAIIKYGLVALAVLLVGSLAVAQQQGAIGSLIGSTRLLGGIRALNIVLNDNTGAVVNPAIDATHDTAKRTTGPQGMLAAVAHGADPTAVTAGDAVNGIANRDGIQFMLGGHPNTITAEAQVQDADGAQTDAALVTVSAGTKIVVTQLMAACDNGTTNGTNIVVGFGATTLPARVHTGANGILGAMDNVPPGGGFVRGDGNGILGIGADGEDLRLTMEDPIGGNCSVTYSYFTIES